TEFRSKEIFPTMLVFGILILLIFNFAFEFRSEITPNTVAAILWITFIFTGLLSLSKSFAIEKENNALLSLILTPTDKIYIYTGKLLSNFILIFLMELIITAVFILFFNLDFLSSFFPVLGVVALGTVGFISIGTFFSSMALNTKLKELMLPVLTFPIIIPVIITSVKICSSILEGKELDYYKSSLQVLVTFDIIFVAACAVLFEYLIEDS
ncbi:MAG: heme exporter protein CcmB, partial [Thermodesulfobacteriota bacterium]